MTIHDITLITRQEMTDDSAPHDNHDMARHDNIESDHVESERATSHGGGHDDGDGDERSSPLRDISLVVARVLSGLFAGFFLTYAMSVIVGLRRVDDVTYVSTFQAINATIQNPTFAVVFFGALPASVTAALLHRGSQRRLIGIGAAFLFATMVITFVFNVPLNNELATYVDVNAASAAVARADFENTWNRWNLLRTGSAVIGFILVAVSLRSDGGRQSRHASSNPLTQ